MNSPKPIARRLLLFGGAALAAGLGPLAWQTAQAAPTVKAAPTTKTAPAAKATPAAEDEGSPHGDISIDCGDCHREDQWVPVTKPPVFKHDKTGFPLIGAHTGVGCRKCHTTLVFN